METKTTLNDSTIQTLQRLIKTNIDSRDGLNEAAENTDEMSVACMLRELATERNQQVSELRTLVSANHEDPQSGGSVAAAAHRTWMNLRSAIGGGAGAMLGEAERGEDYIKSQYEEVLKDVAGSAVTDVLNRQYAAVKASHDRVREMRDSYNN